MSVFSYNGVYLPYAYHTNFSQETVYDDVGPGNTDKIYTRFNITVSSVININYWSHMGITGDATDIASLMVKTRTALLQPRRKLSITIGGVDLIPQTTLEGKLDAKNGPHPQSCQITQLTNETFLVVFHIIAHYWENPNMADGVYVNNRIGGSIVYNRWQEIVEMDDLMMSTFTRTGRFGIASNNASGDLADSYREEACAAGVHVGCLRVYSKYAISEDGLSVAYQFKDKEVYKMPPAILGKVGGGVQGSAYRAKGTYFESTSPGSAKQHGYNRMAVVDLTLWGSKHTSQSLLISTAFAIVNAKLHCAGSAQTSEFPGSANAGKNIALTISTNLTVDMYENVVNLRMQAIMDPKKFGGRAQQRTAGQQFNYKGWTFTPGSDGLKQISEEGINGMQPKYLLRGSAKAFIEASAYYDPSLRNVKVDKFGRFGTGKLIGTAGLSAESLSVAETNAGVGTV